VGQITVALGIIHSIADDEQVRYGESDVICVDLLNTTGGLVEERRDAQRFWSLLEEYLAEVGEGEARVEDVFDDEDVLAFDGLIQVLDELDCAGGALPLAIAGNGNEVEGGIDLYRAGQVCKEDCCALEY